MFKVDINKRLMEHVKRSHKYSAIADGERKKAQTEADRKTRRKKTTEQRDPRSSSKEKAHLIHLITLQMHLIQKLLNYKTNLNNDCLY